MAFEQSDIGGYIKLWIKERKFPYEWTGTENNNPSQIFVLPYPIQMIGEDIFFDHTNKATGRLKSDKEAWPYIEFNPSTNVPYASYQVLIPVKTNE